MDILERVENALANEPALQKPRTTTRVNTRTPERQVRWNLPGFGPMTRISTSFGEVHAQALRKRDMIRTQSGQLKEIKFVDRVKLDAGFMKNVTDAQAILIRAGSLGDGLPKADVIVSPSQRVGMGRHGDVRFLKASELLGRPGVVRKPEEIMTYTMFHCGEPVVARCEGLWMHIAP
ncbi:Hint domain-containing protein [Ovoidimarina sediminis]|uniref:Hint domain-containing protein n=1 Tax=Ovoidimarina sediminis TaxID=3079856 RepID=UPI00290A2189|nr:Hint domain-containing protein [Rhodophyticola sp. MJ-SS7]MDU8943083.1 Hint domain-containing protein [Rhodophyticola sp. MJ-SS7]